MTPYRWLKKFFKDGRYWDDLAFFRSVSLFHGLRARDMGRIMQVLQKRTYHAGEVLFAEGQPGKAVYIIQSGKVRLTRSVAKGGERVLGELGGGHIFGEMALLENQPRVAGAVMIEPGDVYLLYTATLESLVRTYPSIGAVLMKNLAIMLSGLVRRANHEIDGKHE
jgi:CRP-like cAMP-binding protein